MPKTRFHCAPREFFLENSDQYREVVALPHGVQTVSLPPK